MVNDAFKVWANAKLYLIAFVAPLPGVRGGSGLSHGAGGKGRVAYPAQGVRAPQMNRRAENAR